MDDIDLVSRTIKLNLSFFSGLCQFLRNEDTLEFRGFISYFLQVGAVFASIRALVPVVPVKVDLGRPIFIYNCNLAAEYRGMYDKGSEVLADFRELQDDPPECERIITCYKDSSGAIDVLEDLASWGKYHEPVSAVQSNPNDPSIRWQSEWASKRKGLGCPTDKGRQFLRSSWSRGTLDLLMLTFMNKYNYWPEANWIGRNKGQAGMIRWEDDKRTSYTICEYFEAKCGSDHERARVIDGMLHGSKTLNIVRIRNNSHEVVSDVHVFLGNMYRNPGNVVQDVAAWENLEIDRTSYQLHVVIKSLPPKSSRFLITESHGAPLQENDIRVESPLSTKFGVNALRWIAGSAFLFTSLIALLST